MQKTLSFSCFSNFEDVLGHAKIRFTLFFWPDQKILGVYLISFSYIIAAAPIFKKIE
jgi:hypothetical protein